MTRLPLLAGFLLSAFAPFAGAQAGSAGGETRAQVKAETLEAARNGELHVGDDDRKQNELMPDRFPKKAMAPTKSRADVKGELAQARKDGDLAIGDQNETARDQNPKRYPPKPMSPGLTRAQVKDETQAAIRAGDVQVGDSGETLAQQNPARYQGAPAKAPKLSLHRRAKAASASDGAN